MNGNIKYVLKRFKKISITLLFSCSVLSSVGQQVIVVDKTNKKPIKNVFIYDKTNKKSYITDKDGKTQLINTQENTLFFFQHVGFDTLSISFEKLKEKKFQLPLSPSSIKLSEVYVSAHRWEFLDREITSQIASVDMQSIDISAKQTLAEILGKADQVFIQKSQMGGGSPMIRGFAANRILIILDGVRVNNAIFRSGNLHNVIFIDPNIIEKTEVILGPSSILYGSDALGGVLYLKTKKPSLKSEDSLQQISLHGMTRYSTANQGKTIHLLMGYRKKKWAIQTGITINDFGHLKSGSQRSRAIADFGKNQEYVIVKQGTDMIQKNKDPSLQIPSSYQQYHVNTNLSWKISPSLHFNYSVHFTTSSDIPRYDRLSEYEGVTPKYAEWYYGPQKWVWNTLSINYKTPHILFDNIYTNINFQFIEESRVQRKLWSRERISLQEFVKVLSFQVHMKKQINKHRLLYGVQSHINWVHSIGYQRNEDTHISQPFPSRYPDGGTFLHNSSIYFLYHLPIFKKSWLNVGTRYNLQNLQTKFSNNSFYDFPFDKIDLLQSAFTGNVGLSFLFSSLGIKWNMASGFRMPNIDDIAKVFDSEPGRVLVPNPDLKPEYAYTTDILFSYEVKNKINSYKLEFGGFYTWFIDAMVRSKTTFQGKSTLLYKGVESQIWTLDNKKRAWIKGISAKAKVNIKRINFVSSFSLSKGKIENTNENLQHIPPYFGYVSMGYKTKKIDIKVRFNYNGSLSFDELSPSERAKTHLYSPLGVLEWQTIDIHFKYRIKNQIFLFFGVENILDTYYRPYSWGMSGAGRSFIFSIQF